MKIELNIDQTTLGPTIEDVFKTLSQEDKAALAKQVMLEFLNTPHNGERKVHEAEVVKGIKLDPYYRDWTEERIRSNYVFTEKMGQWQSTHNKMVRAISDAAVAEYRAQAKELVQNDEQLKQVAVVVMEEIRKDFPKFVHDAMMAYFVEQMNGMSQGLIKSLCQANNAESLTQQINQRLMSRGI